jgi:hypothetical protein
MHTVTYYPRLLCMSLYTRMSEQATIQEGIWTRDDPEFDYEN